MQTKCVVCGKCFTKSPSDKTVTCSAACRSKRRSQMLTGRGVSAVTREKISERAKQRGYTDNLRRGTPAAQASPKSGRFTTNSSAKSWILLSPDGRRFECTNLNEWIRHNVELFNCELTDENVSRIASGFRVIKRNIKRGRGCQTYKGWTLESWNDLKNIDIDREKNTNENQS